MKLEFRLGKYRPWIWYVDGLALFWSRTPDDSTAGALRWLKEFLHAV